MACNTCNGKGTIFRPYGRLVQDVIRKLEVINGEEFATKETVVTETGGIDACPVCTAKAEAEYQALKDHPRGEVRRIA